MQIPQDRPSDHLLGRLQPSQAARSCEETTRDYLYENTGNQIELGICVVVDVRNRNRVPYPVNPSAIRLLSQVWLAYLH